MKTRITLVALFSAALGAGGYAAVTALAPWAQPAGGDGEAREPLYYRHPHDASITSEEPKKDEMGMDYIPVYPGEAQAGKQAPGVVEIPSGVVQAMSVRTAEVQRGPLQREISTVGHVEADEAGISRIDLRTEGWIEALEVAREGDPVEEGDVLFRYFSPRLLNAQQELLQAVEGGRAGGIPAAERRLRSLGLDEAQIRAIRERGEPFQRLAARAPQDGVVKDLNIREGDRFSPGDHVMAIADLSTVWVMAEVFAHRGAWLEPGLPATVSSRYLPGGPRETTVDYVQPFLQQETRTTRARLALDNADRQLRPGMYTRVDIQAEPTEPLTHVPRDAVIRTGAEARVILALGGGRFRAQQVAVGMAAGDRLAVDGVRPGAEVVVSGQFLLDSEADVAAELLRLEGAGPRDITARGVLRAVDPRQGGVTIEHEPIPELGWSEMTMEFDLAEGVEPGDLEPGDAVTFALRPGAGQKARITAIERDEGADDASNGAHEASNGPEAGHGSGHGH
ncbi:efflux RND transporter periplasmic adaptor subunit [Halorhodospira neutriphila]|uniref:Efflux transporter, RND family, MFP subunit n=1 Tax=Halorhodospira neutriphila TaxID=168379 RepID=A0ABS1E6N8_9GAMM|nr:efflux RND transporter periplasmic adaptor subunit [Halorhodospira neutriphila]MBK1726056.1 hypothetical protein [Halorhodospira neutriphila]